MSRALPCGIPSMTSNITTSPSCLRPMRWARVPRIWPARINAILLRAMVGKLSTAATAERGRVVVNRLGLARQGTETRELHPCIHYTSKRLAPSPEPKLGSGLDDCFGIEPGALSRPMWEPEVGLRPHLGQARSGALEFVSLIPVCRNVELVGLRLRRGQQLHSIVVKRVDQNDEALGLVPVGVIHHRNVVEDHGMELVRDLEIVACGERLRA